MTTPFSIYLHVPYCAKKCPYCDFNSHVAGLKGLSAETEDHYTEALIRELRAYGTEPPFAGRIVGTVFFGGGTPSLFSSASIALILEEVTRLFPLSPACEVTLEANPGTIQEELGRSKLTELRAAGINRLSLGCQSFNTNKLSFLGRIHSADDIRRAVIAIREAGFNNLNLDLIYGVKNETLEDWAADLEDAAAFGPEHLSAYTLTIEPNTEFGVRAGRGEVFAEPDDRQAEFYEYTVRRLKALGFEQYEVSNFSRPGRRCEHNWRYWHDSDYLGLGAGAHSYTRETRRSRRWANIKSPGLYIERVRRSGAAAEFEESVTEESAVVEFLYLRLRCTEGFTETEYEQCLARPLCRKQRATIQKLREQGLLESDTDRVRLTTRGFLLMDSVLEALFD